MVKGGIYPKGKGHLLEKKWSKFQNKKGNLQKLKGGTYVNKKDAYKGKGALFKI